MLFRGFPFSKMFGRGQEAFPRRQPSCKMLLSAFTPAVAFFLLSVVVAFCFCFFKHQVPAEDTIPHSFLGSATP